MVAPRVVKAKPRTRPGILIFKSAIDCGRRAIGVIDFRENVVQSLRVAEHIATGHRHNG